MRSIRTTLHARAVFAGTLLLFAAAAAWGCGTQWTMPSQSNTFESRTLAWQAHFRYDVFRDDVLFFSAWDLLAHASSQCGDTGSGHCPSEGAATNKMVDHCQITNGDVNYQHEFHHRVETGVPNVQERLLATVTCTHDSSLVVHSARDLAMSLPDEPVNQTYAMHVYICNSLLEQQNPSYHGSM